MLKVSQGPLVFVCLEVIGVCHGNLDKEALGALCCGHFSSLLLSEIMSCTKLRVDLPHHFVYTLPRVPRLPPYPHALAGKTVQGNSSHKSSTTQFCLSANGCDVIVNLPIVVESVNFCHCSL